MKTQDWIELLSFDTLVILLVSVQFEDAMRWLELILVISAIIYNVVRIRSSIKNKDKE
jgi:hypothetical protein